MQEDFKLERFIEAQGRNYGSVIKELRAGQKRGHWMWYIFPQIQGLGTSATSRKYAISGQGEAKAYSAHPLLGPRLLECTQLVLDMAGKTIDRIFYYPDNLKFRSCMTLFEMVTTHPSVFQSALLKYYHGIPDQLTLDIITGQG